MRKAKRIQRKRTKGFKMSENAVYVGRGSKYGNPIKLIGDQIYINAAYRRKILDKWVHFKLGDIDEVLRLFELLLTGGKFENPDMLYWSEYFQSLDLTPLKGKDLSCWCPLDKPCHADILLNHVEMIHC